MAAAKNSPKSKPRPRNKRQASEQDERGGGRRQQIIEASTRLFAEQGFEATTVRQIADEVQILSGSLYYYYTTKEEIVHDIIRDVIAELRDNVIRISGYDGDAEIKLSAMVLYTLDLLNKKRDVFSILYKEENLFLRREEFSYTVEVKNDVYAAWTSILEDGMKNGLFDSQTDVYLTIMTVVRALNAATDWYRAGTAIGVNYTLEQLTDFYLKFVLHAVRDRERVGEPVPREAAERLACGDQTEAAT